MDRPSYEAEGPRNSPSWKLPGEPNYKDINKTNHKASGSWPTITAWGPLEEQWKPALASPENMAAFQALADAEGDGVLEPQGPVSEMRGSSSWLRPIRVIARMGAWKLAAGVNKRLTPELLQWANTAAFRIIQAESFPGTLDTLRRLGRLPDTHPLARVRPILDGEGVMRVNSRLRAIQGLTGSASSRHPTPPAPAHGCLPTARAHTPPQTRGRPRHTTGQDERGGLDER